MKHTEAKTYRELGLESGLAASVARPGVPIAPLFKLGIVDVSLRCSSGRTTCGIIILGGQIILELKSRVLPNKSSSEYSIHGYNYLRTSA